MVIYYLTCKDKREADKISRVLLEDKLIACARCSQINSSYWWEDKIESTSEALLMMESIEEKFEAIDKTVAKLHSYDEYVLTMVPVLNVNSGALNWLKKSLA